MKGQGNVGGPHPDRAAGQGRGADNSPSSPTEEYERSTTPQATEDTRPAATDLGAGDRPDGRQQQRGAPGQVRRQPDLLGQRQPVHPGHQDVDQGQADRPARLAGRDLPPDTIVAVVVRGVHRSARYWKGPDRFDPGRWADGAAAAGLESDTFFPFGRGPRACVGAGLAMFCLRVMLAALLSRSRVVIDPNMLYRQFFHCGVGEPKHIMGGWFPISESARRVRSGPAGLQRSKVSKQAFF
jgi:hypothetical protein